MTETNTTAETDETDDEATIDLLKLPIPETGRPVRDLRAWIRRYKKTRRKLRSMRRYHGDLQASLHTWRHKDGRLIVLIGMFHIADPAFYKQVLLEIESWRQLGANVYYEQVNGPATPEEFAALNPLERQTLLAIMQKQVSQMEMAHAMGLVMQGEAFQPGDGWTRADVDVRDELPLFGYQKMIVTMRASLWFQRKLRLPVKLPTTGAQRARRRWVTRMTPWMTRLSLLASDRDHLMDLRVARDHRDILATQALLSAPADAPVVGVWGTSHLPGIGLYLWRAGFELSDIQWFTAVAKRPETAIR